MVLIVKIRNRKVIIDLIPHLISPDIESAKIALGILLELPYIKNLSKYYTTKIHTSWPGWSSECPKHLYKISSQRSPSQTVRVKDFIQSVMCMPITTEYEQNQFFEGVLKVCYMIDNLLNPYSNTSIQRYAFRELRYKFDFPNRQIEFNTSNENEDERQIKRHIRLNYQCRRLRQENLKNRMVYWDNLGNLSKLKKNRKIKKFVEINGQRFYFNNPIHSNINWNMSSNLI